MNFIQYRKNKLLFTFIMFIVIFIKIPIALSDIELKPNVIYHPNNSGEITFSKSFLAKRLYFQDGSLIIQGFSNGYGSWDKIGFSCETVSATMNIDSIGENQIKYTVDAVANSSSKTIVHVGTKGVPTKVDGSYEWSYKHGTKAITIYAAHTSPKAITIIWESEAMENWITKSWIPTFEFFSFVAMIVVIGILFSVMQGGTATSEEIVALLLIAITCALAVYIAVIFQGF